MSEPPANRIDELLETCILALERGEQETVEKLLAEHPNAAPELRRRLDRLAALGVLAAPSSGPDIPERLGEFRLLRQIGRGGMGVVYLAEQDALERQVALKLVHPEQLYFGGARQRFRREVLSIARLQHPGIVPILTCGEHEGIPYYAMELVHGASLAEVVAQLVGTSPLALDGETLRGALHRCMTRKHDHSPVLDAPVFQGTWSKVCCRLVRQAAQALQHAHEQGVLHRDLKPSNLLLTEAGRVRVIDFGLASASGELRITRSGSTLGSLPYMAPEQLRGERAHVDRRCDVYQLGVTMYELLTTRLPHGDDSDGTTRERILAGLVSAPSRLNANVHPDVDAICLKAMDVDPGRRYPDAGALADDLLAFLEQRTVVARRPPLPVRARRYVRRHPFSTATAIVALVVFVFGPIAFALQQAAANADIQDALTSAEARRAIAEQNFDEALRAVDLMLLRTSQARLAKMPRTSALRRQLVIDAITVHERLVSTTATGDARLEGARARSLRKLGKLHHELGELDEAEHALDTARTILLELISGAPVPDDERLRSHLQELAASERGLASLYGRTGRANERLAAYERALGHYRTLAPDPLQSRYRQAYVRVELSRARALTGVGRHDDAERLLQTLDRDFAGEPAPAHALSPTVRALLRSRIADSRGALFATRGDNAAAALHFEEAARRAVSPHGADADEVARRELAWHRAIVTERLGNVSHAQRQWERAGPWLDAACGDFEALAAEEPELPDYRVALARCLGTRAHNRVQLGNSEHALADHDRAIALLQSVQAAAPTDINSGRVLALAHCARAGYRLQTGQPQHAIADLQAAQRMFEDLCARDPRDMTLCNNYAASLANQAIAFAAQHEHARALELSELAIDVQNRVEGAQSQRQLVEMMTRASEFAFLTEDQRAGRDWMQRARDCAADLLAGAPHDGLALDTKTFVEIDYGVMLLSFHQLDDAINHWHETLPIARRAAERSGFGRHQLRLLQLRMADACLRKGDVANARLRFQAAVADGATIATAGHIHALAALFDRDELR